MRVKTHWSSFIAFEYSKNGHSDRVLWNKSCSYNEPVSLILRCIRIRQTRRDHVSSQLSSRCDWQTVKSHLRWSRAAPCCPDHPEPRCDPAGQSWRTAGVWTPLRRDSRIPRLWSWTHSPGARAEWTRSRSSPHTDSPRRLSCPGPRPAFPLPGFRSHGTPAAAGARDARRSVSFRSWCRCAWIERLM